MNDTKNKELAQYQNLQNDEEDSSSSEISGEIFFSDDEDSHGSPGKDFVKFQRQLIHLVENVPPEFLNKQFAIRLNEAGSISSKSSISEKELIKLEEDAADVEEPDDKTLRELFYEAMIEKYYRVRKSTCGDPTIDAEEEFLDEEETGNAPFNIEQAEESTKELVVDYEEQNIAGELREKKETKVSAFSEQMVEAIKEATKNLMSQMDDVSEESDIFQKRLDKTLFLNMSPLETVKDRLSDIKFEPPEEIIPDYPGCKSLHSLMEEKNLVEGRKTSLNAILCLFSYDKNSCDSDIHIEQEIFDLVFSLNYNTINVKQSKCDNPISGCVLANGGVGVVSFECDLLDSIRLVNALDWSSLCQKVDKIRVIRTLAFTSSKFKTFLLGKPVMDNDDSREFPDFADKSQEKLVHDYLRELSKKLGSIFDLISLQSKNHECGAANLPPCTINMFPSKQLLMWALKCPFFRDWNDIIKEIMEPEPYFDFTNESYPFPTDTFSLKTLFFPDEYKDKIYDLYTGGFMPTFGEGVTPVLPVKEEFRKVAEEGFEETAKFFTLNK